MPAGDTFKSEIEEYSDRVTGARVRRLTSGDAHNHHLYFTASSYTKDGHIVFGSERTGSPQLFLMEMPEGRIVQLTDEEGLRPQLSCLHPDKGLAYYTTSRQVKQVDLQTFKTEVLYEAPEGFGLSLPSITGDGSRLAVAYSQKLAMSTETGRIYSTMGEHYYQRPISCVVAIETDGSGPAVIWGERAWISHVCISPVDRDCVVYCHEGGSWVKQRMWVVSASAKHQEARPLMPQFPDTVAYHEYFTKDGQIGVQMHAPWGEGREFFHCFMRPDGSWLRQYKLPGLASGHIQSNSDNSVRIADRAYRTPEDRAGEEMMGLYRFDGGWDRVTWLCERGGDFSLQIGHGHPIFSPDDAWVLFTSNRGGVCQVYTAEVGGVAS
ncbi:MAG: oligogalacturonate lyase family protein [Armatimonadetes bacterium]|nr:oligogalacturonate lyase family protein [Armatimonadota bacterium]